MPSSKERVKVIVACQHCYTAYNGVRYVRGTVTSGGLKKHIYNNKECYDSYFLDPDQTYRNNFFDLNSSIVKTNACLPVKQPRGSRIKIFPTIPPSKFGLTGTSNCPGPQPTLGGTSSRSQKIDHPTLNRQTTRVGGYQPDVSRDSILGALNTPTETMMNTSPSYASGTSNSYPEHELLTNDDDASDSITSLLSDGTGLPLDDNTLDETSHTGDYVEDHANDDDEGPTFGDFQQDANNDVPVYVGVPQRIIAQMNDTILAEVELLHLMEEHKLHMNVMKPIWDWAVKSQSRPHHDFSSTHHRTRNTILKDIQSYFRHSDNPDNSEAIVQDDFSRVMITVLPDNTPVDLFVRPFHVALNSLLSKPELMQQSKLSLPNLNDPFSFINNPPVDTITELHHGSWWAESWRDANLDPQKNEMLVPIIFYMDGISLDSHGRLTLTPLNMTLGIFSTETRKSNEAWETIYFHPDLSSLTPENREKKSVPFNNLQNLHRGLEAALGSFRSQCRKTTVFPNLPWNDRTYQVSMKFAVAFVIGDTELHDKLCGRYGSHSSKTAYACRHCNCKTDDIVNINAQNSTRLWIPDDFCVRTHARESNHWKDISHHPITNAFNRIDFGSNLHKIHFATPGECLHMHQLGVAKRAIEVFKEMILKKPDNDSRKGHRDAAYYEISRVAQNYGTMLSRQSDRNFPRTKFHPILEDSRKNGKDYLGVILCVVLTLLTNTAKTTLNNSAFIDNHKINDCLKVFELILFFDEFLKHCGMKKSNIEKLSVLVKQFVSRYTTVFKRGTGNGQNLIKNHLYFHLHQYIEMFGPPAGWDSSPCEGHHKTDIKAPSKNTQQNSSSIIEQTCRRKIEKSLINKAMSLVAQQYLYIPDVEQDSRRQAGASYKIFLDENNNPVMDWDLVRNRKKAHIPAEVLELCCETFLSPTIDQKYITGFTEFNYSSENEHYKFRSNPSYRSDNGQSSHVWYDWADFLYLDNDGNECVCPAQILCFVSLSDQQAGEIPAGDHVGGSFAVVRSLTEEPKTIRQSIIVQRGFVDNKLYVYPCSSIYGPVAVVPHQGVERGNDFFVVRNKKHWLKSFHDLLEQTD